MNQIDWLCKAKFTRLDDMDREWTSPHTHTHCARVIRDEFVIKTVAHCVLFVETMHVRRFAYDFIYQIYRFISFSNSVPCCCCCFFYSLRYSLVASLRAYPVANNTICGICIHTHTPPSHHTKMALKLAIEIYSHTKAFVVTHDVLHCVVPLFLKSLFLLRISSLFCFSALLQNSVFVVFLTFSLTHLIRPTE